MSARIGCRQRVKGLRVRIAQRLERCPGGDVSLLVAIRRCIARIRLRSRHIHRGYFIARIRREKARETQRQSDPLLRAHRHGSCVVNKPRLRPLRGPAIAKARRQDIARQL